MKSFLLSGLPVSQEEQHRADPAVGLLLGEQVQLREDRVDVLLDGAFGEEQRVGDGGVRLPLGDLGHDLHLPVGESLER